MALARADVVDVLIAGAGPAGSIAATLLARAGARVRLIDRARFPRDKLCGDTLNPGALARLQQLQVGCAAWSRGIRLDGMVVTGEGGVQVCGRYAHGSHGRALTRRALDAALVDAAIRAGAQFDEHVTVGAPVVDEQGGAPTVRGLALSARGGTPARVRARVTIAADGRRSTIATSLGLLRHPLRPRRWAIGGYFDGLTGLTTYGEMHIRRTHYLGVAPLPDGLANVCFVTADTAGLADPRRRLLAAVAAEPALVERFDQAQLIAPPSTLGPLAADAAAAGVPGLLLAGDAAGFVDPMTGDGLRFAIRGAELAAAVTLEMLARGHLDGHLELARRRHREFWRKQRFNRTLRGIVGSRMAVGVASTTARVLPALVRQLIRVAGDAA